MKTPTRHTVVREHPHPERPEEILRYESEVWIVDLDDAWEVWCTDCGYRLGTTTNPDIGGREDDARQLTRQHEKVMHL